MVIRDVYPGELAEIGELRLAAYRTDGFLTPESSYALRLRELGSDGLGVVLVAVESDSGPPLGTVMLQSWPHAGKVVQGPGEGEIRALAVRHEARSTQPDMKAAQHLYEKAGFIRLPERDWAPEPGDPLLAFGMQIGAGQAGRLAR